MAELDIYVMSLPVIVFLMDKIVAKDYKIAKKLGSGAFGEVFMALNIKNHTEYAVKMEKASTKSPQLFY